MPPHISKFLIVTFITLDVGQKLLVPEIFVIGWPNKILATLMNVPEASIYEYGCLIFWKYYIRPARVA